jgi:ectoine hydroxylase-related dioxygenase (phytanoyl-CoA dioxygenase family)
MKQSNDTYLPEIQEKGFVVLKNLLDETTVNRFISEIESVQDKVGIKKFSTVYAIRNLMDAVPGLRQLPREPAIRQVLTGVLGDSYFPVRAILFDKLPTANWNVGWHQDNTIAVKSRIDTPGFGPWSKKAGVVHVQPPADILDKMLTVRIHLDDCDESNGPLKVIAGSHAHGKLDDNQIDNWIQKGTITHCTTPRGGAVILRPLLLHASSSSEKPAHRRVIHLEFASHPLPNNLEWHNLND